MITAGCYGLTPPSASIPSAQLSGQAIIFGSKWPHSIDRVLGTKKKGDSISIPQQ